MMPQKLKRATPQKIHSTQIISNTHRADQTETHGRQSRQTFLQETKHTPEEDYSLTEHQNYSKIQENASIIQNMLALEWPYNGVNATRFKTCIRINGHCWQVP